MNIKNKELALSLVERGNVGRLPFGIFSQIQENLNDMSLGMGTSFFEDFLLFNINRFEQNGRAYS